MTFLYVPHLILAGLMGINSISTINKVSVKPGDSISIPCLYHSKYINHVKYLCKGDRWPSCSYAVRTNKPDDSGKFSISDDPNQRIFTVTINNLTTMDADSRYWCAVERDVMDVKQPFKLSVITTGMPSLYVDRQEITAFKGGSVTVRCHYTNYKVTKWCRLGSWCLTDQAGSTDGTVSINASVPNVFTVTMSELRAEHSSWYWCANKDFEIPVRITVHELPSTTTTTMSPTTENFTGTPTTTQHSSLLTSAEPHTAQPTHSTMNGATGEGLQAEHKSSTMVTILTTTLCLLLLVVPAAFFGWRTMINRNKTKPEGSDITGFSQTGSDPDVHYATVVHKQHVAAQRKNDKPEESVTYSTIVMTESVRKMTEPEDGSVIYSTLHIKQNNC